MLRFALRSWPSLRRGERTGGGLEDDGFAAPPKPKGHETDLFAVVCQADPCASAPQNRRPPRLYGLMRHVGLADMDGVTALYVGRQPASRAGRPSGWASENRDAETTREAIRQVHHEASFRRLPVS